MSMSEKKARLANSNDLFAALSDQFYDGLRKAYITFYFDISGSMQPHQAALLQTAKATLKALSDRNQTAEDTEFLVRIVCFNNIVKVVNDAFLPPEQLLELIDESTFCCDGGTNLTAIVNQIDSDCSRNGAAFANKHTSDLQPFCILVTDFVGTDAESSRQAAMNRLLNNQLYVNKSQALCVFVGPDSEKANVEALAGGADRVIALESDLERYLTPVIMGSTVQMSESTHLSMDSSSSIAEQVANRLDDGSSSASELEQQLKQLLS